MGVTDPFAVLLEIRRHVTARIVAALDDELRKALEESAAPARPVADLRPVFLPPAHTDGGDS